MNQSACNGMAPTMTLLRLQPASSASSLAPPSQDLQQTWNLIEICLKTGLHCSDKACHLKSFMVGIEMVLIAYHDKSCHWPSSINSALHSHSPQPTHAESNERFSFHWINPVVIKYLTNRCWSSFWPANHLMGGHFLLDGSWADATVNWLLKQ